MSSTKKQKSNFWFFKKWKLQAFCIFRVFEQLFNSIGWRVMAFSHNGLSYFLRDLIFY